ncbi:MAG: HAMP domain-containing histidine kinase [Oscillospiraceae bacterium]|nr:HAMP domain-containing histidine kinase [Oscillospiraceae bacterium]
MDNKRLRKAKTVKTEDVCFAMSLTGEKIADAVRKQQTEILKIPAEFENECQNIRGQGFEMIRISRNLGEYYSAVAGKENPRRENTELCETLEFLCKGAEEFAKLREMRILCKLPKEKVLVKINRESFDYAFYNILRNSMEHSGPKSRIKVVLTKSKRFAKIAVSDNGEGMTEEILCRCAEPFFSGTPWRKNLGIGLTIAEHFVKSSGGRVKIRSEKGKGTTVSIFLPLETKDEVFVSDGGKRLSIGGIFIPAYVSFSGIAEKEMME